MKRAYLIVILAVMTLALPGVVWAADKDNDGYPDAVDNCPDKPNGDCGDNVKFCDVNKDGTVTPEELEAGYQVDRDGPGKGDACDDSDLDTIEDYRDNCPTVKNKDQDSSVCADADGDGAFDSADNCTNTYNQMQEDTDADGVGDWCDNCRFISNSDQADSNLDGVGDACKTVEQQSTSVSQPPQASETPEKKEYTAPKFNDGCSLVSGSQAGLSSAIAAIGWLASMCLIALRRKGKK